MNRFVAALVSVSTFLIVGTAHAQDLSEDEIQEYQEAVGDAAVAYDEGEYHEALEALQRAQGIYEHPDLMYNLGRTYQQLHWCERARQTFLEYAARTDIGTTDRKNARRQMDSLKTCEERRQVTFDCEEARLEMEGVQPVCGESLELSAGSYRLEASRAGYVSGLEEFSVSASDGDIVISIALEPEAMEVAQPLILPEQESADWHSVAGWSLVGAAGAAMVAGLVLDATSPQGADISESQEGRKTAIIGLYGAGVVLGAAGAGILVWHYTEGETTAALRISPSGVQAHLRF